MLFLELISKYTNGDDFSLLRSSFVQQAKCASPKAGQRTLGDPLFDIASQPIFKEVLIYLECLL
jgi:hypothetical protein